MKVIRLNLTDEQAEDLKDILEVRLAPFAVDQDSSFVQNMQEILDQVEYQTREKQSWRCGIQTCGLENLTPPGEEKICYACHTRNI